jgi:hypothetical protein
MREPFILHGKEVVPGQTLKVIRDQINFAHWAHAEGYPVVGMLCTVAEEQDLIDTHIHMRFKATDIGYPDREDDDDRTVGRNLERASLGLPGDPVEPELFIDPIPITKELRPIDRLIRPLLLRYPSLYRKRIEVLFSIFLSSGFEWKDGVIVPDRYDLTKHPFDRGLHINPLRYMKEFDTVYTSQMLHVDQPTDHGDLTEGVRQLYVKMAEDRAKELERKLAEDLERSSRIDEICSTCIPGDTLNRLEHSVVAYMVHSNMISMFSKGVLWDMPVEVEQSCYDAACEFMDAMVNSHDFLAYPKSIPIEKFNNTHINEIAMCWNDFHRSRKPSEGKYWSDIPYI